MMPSCDQIGVPIHFHSSTTSGSASLMSLRILLRVSPRQSPSSAILFEMSADADCPWLASDFVMFSSWSGDPPPASAEAQKPIRGHQVHREGRLRRCAGTVPPNFDRSQALHNASPVRLTDPLG